MIEMIAVKPFTILSSGFATLTATTMVASTDFASEHPEVLTYLIGIISLGFLYMMVYVWKTSWKQQNIINEKIIERLEKIDDKMEEKIERLKEEVYKSEINHAQIRVSEKESLQRENAQMELIINKLKDITEKISKVNIVKV